MNYGFQEQTQDDPNEEFMKRLKAMLDDTGFAGLRGLLSQLMVAPTEGLSGGGASGMGGGGGGGLGGSSGSGSSGTGGPTLSTSSSGTIV